jgi:hypothetical protein
MALIKNFGIAGIGQSVQYGKGGGKVVYDTSNSLFKVTTDGSTLSNLNVAAPTADDHAATKLYVDSIAQGLDVKESVKAASTGDMSTSSAVSVVDGVTLQQGDRILLKDQVTGSQNGIYTFASTGAPLARAIDMDATGEFTGSFFFVEEGTVNSDQGFVCTTNGTVTPGSTTVEFAQFTGTGQLTAGDGLSKVGNTIDINVDDTFIKINNSDALTIKGTAVTGEVLKSDGLGGVAYGALDLTNANAIAGALPLANGGLGVDASDSAGKTTARSNLGLGSMATQDASGVAITGGSINIAGGTLELADDQILGDKISGGTIDGANLAGATGNTIVGYDITVGAGKTLDVDGVLDVDGAAGSAIDNVAIGATNSAAGTFSTLASDSVDLNGGAIDAVTIGATGADAGTFTNLTANTLFKADTVESKTAAGSVTFNSPIVAAAGIDVSSINSPTVTTDSIIEKTLDQGVDVDGVVLKDAGVAATGVSTFANLTATTADINGGTVDATVIGATTSAAGTFSTMATLAATITGGDISGTNLDMTGQTLLLDNGQINGDAIDGGTITDFASIGIDDNVTPLGLAVADGGTETRTTTTVLTLTDTSATFGADLIVNGDLTVSGTTTTVNSTETLVADRILTLNAGEVGDGVTNGAAGIEVDRGSYTDVDNNLQTNDIASLLWNETDDVWEFKLGNALADLRIGSQSMDAIAVDAINELTPGNGITFGHDITGVNAEFSGAVTVNTISELTSGVGVTVDSVLLKDGAVTGGLLAESTDTVNVSAATLVLGAGQIDGAAISGGVIDTITITALTATSADINAGTVDATVIGGATSAAGTFSTLASDSVDLNGGAMDGVVIGANASAASTFSTMATDSADINGGAIDGTAIGATTPAAGTFSTLTSANAAITGGSITGASLTSTVVDFGGGEMDAVVIGANTSAAGTFSTLESNNVTLTGGTASLATVTATDLNSGNVTITGGAISGTSIDLTGQTLTLGDDSISGDVIHNGTISNSSLLGKVHNTDNPSDHSTISRHDITVGANFTLDVSAGTLTLADNQILGDKIHGGTISDFASTGIDDNATATKMTLTDTAATFAVNGDFGANTLAAGAATLASATVTGDAVIQGNLTVSGAVTTTLSETVAIEDNMIELNSNVAANAAPTEDSGIVVNRGSSHNAQWYWDETDDVWSSEDANGAMANIKVGEIQAASFGLTGQIARTDGGTGTDTAAFADDSLMVMAAAGAVAELAKGANSTVLKVNDAGALGYAKVVLTSDVSGILPMANGGTGIATSGLANQVLITDGTALAYGYQETLRTAAGDVAIQTSGMTTSEYLDMSSTTGSVTLTAKNSGGSGVVDMYLQGQDGGDVFLVGQAGEAVLQGDDDTDLTVSGGVSVAGDAGDLVLKGGNGTSNGISGDVVIKGGTGGATEGKVQVYGSKDTLIATFVETSDSAVDSLEIKNGIGGVELAAVGTSAEANLVLAPKTADNTNGTGGMVMLPAGTHIDFDNSDDMVVSTKKYVDDEIAKVGDNFLRVDFSANGGSQFTVGNIKDVAGKLYYVKSVTIKILTAFVGCDEITVSDGANDLVSTIDVDMSEAGLYIIEQGYENTTAQNATITATLGNGGSSASPTVGRAIVSVEYKAINQ